MAIARYDIELVPDFEKNAMFTRAKCQIQNDGASEIKHLDFDILGREQLYAIKMDVKSICLQVGEKNIPQRFSHLVPESPNEPNAVGTHGKAKVVSVTLTKELKPAEVIDLVFEYNWQVVEPTKEDMNYRLFATLPNGEKEVCLLADYAWIPTIKAGKRTKPTWKINIAVPAGYESVVLDGRFAGIEKKGKKVITRWEWRSPGLPQVMIGRFERFLVKNPHINVVFYLPKGTYEEENLNKFAEYMAQAYSFYSELYGPLNGREIHIGISSAGQGGHGAYLGTTLDTFNIAFLELLDTSLASLYMETVFHELAHSWWAFSVSSYGQGWRFLRESLANFSTWCLIEKIFGKDRFQEWMGRLFKKGTYNSPLFHADAGDTKAAYRKGPIVLKILSSEMGEDVFLRALKNFSIRYKDDYATLSDFVDVCNEVSGANWTAFFDQWYYGEGCPDYHLVNFESKEKKRGWETLVNIKNVGKGTIQCPLELRMANGVRREIFRVEEDSTSAFRYKTSAEVKEVLIDPDHNTYQGSGKERNLKMVGVTEEIWEWLFHWLGAAYGELGAYDKAIAYMSQLIEHDRHPAFFYSRGVTYLLKGDTDLATIDLSFFTDEVLKNPRLMTRGLAYSGVIYGNQQQQRESLNKILSSLTGQDFKYDSTAVDTEKEWEKMIERWQSWWKEHKADFRPGTSAQLLKPLGLQRMPSSITLHTLNNLENEVNKVLAKSQETGKQ